MSSTKTRATWKSPMSPSQPRSSFSRPSTTPHGLPARSPVSVGQPAPPLPPPGAGKSPNIKKASSPSYFGLKAGDSSDSPDSNPGQHARANWDFPCSDANDTPTQRPVDFNPEFEAFRRRSEQGRFDLGNANLAAVSKTGGHQQQSVSPSTDQPRQENPTSLRSVIHGDGPAQLSSPSAKEIGAAKTGPPSFFDIPRRDSPASLSPFQVAALDHRNARLSLPANRLHTPPADPDRRPVQRAETLPGTLPNNGPIMVSSQQFVKLLYSMPDHVLLLDLRVAPQFSISRVSGALNLCIPTTLMKRPSFNTQKLRDTFAGEAERERFSKWRECTHIAVYDSNSTNLNDAQNPVNVLKKFYVEGWKGQGIVLKGGFAELAKSSPSIVEKGLGGVRGDAVKSPLSILPPAQAVAPVAGGCPMPASKTAANPFFNNIRQNMDLIDGVGQLPVGYPAEMSAQCEKSLPEWLQKAVEATNAGKLVSDEFLAIEKTEQKRMQDALKCTVSYGSPRSERPDKVRIAGIEKGAKNRYNNVFPYDHSRVHLQSVAAEGCDYINASHIKAAYSNKRYIATQAPIPATFNDFWRLVWEQDSRVIVMLTAESEGGQLKSHPYWQTSGYGPLKLKILAEKRIPLELKRLKLQQSKSGRPTIGQRRSTNSVPSASVSEKMSAEEPKQGSAETPFVIVRHFTLSHSSLPFEPMREITQLQYTQWPDFGAPAHPQHLLALIEQTSKYVRGSASPSHPAPRATEPAPTGLKPVVVHCSAGCGRTGTFCTVDSVVDMLKRQGTESGHDLMEIDSTDDVHAGQWVHRDDVDLIAKTVEDFRGQRLSMVQSLRQFVLCYESVLDWMVGQRMADQDSNRGEERRRGSTSI